MGPMLELYTLVVQVHTATHCRFYREQHWVLHLLRLAMKAFHHVIADILLEMVLNTHKTYQWLKHFILHRREYCNVLGFLDYFTRSLFSC